MQYKKDKILHIKKNTKLYQWSHFIGIKSECRINLRFKCVSPLPNVFLTDLKKLILSGEQFVFTLLH